MNILCTYDMSHMHMICHPVLQEISASRFLELVEIWLIDQWNLTARVEALDSVFIWCPVDCWENWNFIGQWPWHYVVSIAETTNVGTMMNSKPTRFSSLEERLFVSGADMNDSSPRLAVGSASTLLSLMVAMALFKSVVQLMPCWSWSQWRWLTSRFVHCIGNQPSSFEERLFVSGVDMDNSLPRLAIGSASTSLSLKAVLFHYFLCAIRIMKPMKMVYVHLGCCILFAVAYHEGT